MKEELMPVDLGHLEDKAVMLRDYLRRSQMMDRSQEYRDYFLESAINLSETLVRDFGWYFDTRMIGGHEPYSLSEKRKT